MSVLGGGPRPVLVAAGMLMLVAAIALVYTEGHAQEGPRHVVVTSASDNVDGSASDDEDQGAGEDEGGAMCPDEERCTLRAAIAHVSADEHNDPMVIRFDTEVFNPDEPATIEVNGSPLPSLTRDHVTIDATDAGVAIDGAALDGEGVQVGLWLNADNAQVHGLSVRNFRGACVLATGDDPVIGGSRSAGEGNEVNSCGLGVSAGGDNASVHGNVIGFEPTSDGTPMDVAIEVFDGSAEVGSAGDPDMTNYVGGAHRGIVARTRESSNSTALIRGNVLGQGPGGADASLDYGVTIRPGARGVLVEGNAFHRSGVAVVVEEAGESGVPSTRNTVRDNTYDGIEALAIDLGDDGPTPNDAGDEDNGPNRLQNAPEFVRAVQGRITGTVPGPCEECTVELYVAEHRPGQTDLPTSLVAEDMTTSDGGGEFRFESPPVAPGQWVIATATDADGNTSEFSDAVRMGSGIVQCTSEPLQPGWNAMGWFGSQISLGTTFPPGSEPPGPVGVIHRLDADGQHASWYSGVDTMGTLDRLETGGAYWMHSGEEAAIGGAITLTAAFPVELEPGWNHFVYVGAEAEVPVALESLAGKYTSLFRYDNDGEGDWEIHGGPGTPDWVREFTTMEPCQDYFINMAEGARLEPPQP